MHKALPRPLPVGHSRSEWLEDADNIFLYLTLVIITTPENLSNQHIVSDITVLKLLGLMEWKVKSDWWKKNQLIFVTFICYIRKVPENHHIKFSPYKFIYPFLTYVPRFINKMPYAYYAESKPEKIN